MAEVGQFVARSGMSLEDGNSLVLKLLEKYEHIFDRPEGNLGLPLDQAYDLNTLQPIPAWQKMYEDVKDDLKALGMDDL
jgi:methylamine--corrinoid protein Co-methyltransferase